MSKSMIGYPNSGFLVESDQFSQDSLEDLERTINAKIDKNVSDLGNMYSEVDVSALRPRWIENEWRNIVRQFPDFIRIRR